MHHHPVDLKRRDRWQRGWGAARWHADRRRHADRSRCAHVVGAPRVEGPQGASIDVAGWTFETATNPLPPPARLRLRLAALTNRSMRSVLGPLPLFDQCRETWHANAMRQRRLGPAGESVESFRRLAEVLIAQQAFVEAEDLLSQAHAAFPRDPALAKLHALSARNGARYAGAIPPLDQGARTRHGRPDAHGRPGVQPARSIAPLMSSAMPCRGFQTTWSC